jgi:branched-chain amino acid transport system substrate-binding protein
VRNKANLAAAAALSVLAAGLSGCGSSGSSGGSGPIRIGQEVCQTGYLAASDGHLVSGAKLAVKLLNDKGGILGRKVELVTKDTQCVAANEIQIAHALISQARVNAIIGGYQSAAITSLVPVVQGASTPLIGAGTLPLESPWGITTFPANKYVPQAFVGYFVKKNSVKVLGNIAGDTPFGQALQALVVAEAKGASITTKDLRTANTATTTTPLLQQVSSTQAIFSNTSGPINIIFAKDAANLGLTQPLIFQDSLATCSQAGAAYPDVYCVVAQPAAYPKISDPQVKANEKTLYDLFTADGGKLTNFPAVTAGADQVNLIAKAMAAANSTDGKAVNTALSSLSYTGAQGVYQFTPGKTFGVTVNPYVLLKTSGSEPVVVATPPGSGG